MLIIKDENIMLKSDLLRVVNGCDFSDHDIAILERMIAADYNIDESVFKDWRDSSDAKIMLCFVLRHLLGYSVGWLAKRYHIYKHFLRNKIKEKYKSVLVNANEMKQIDRYRKSIVFKDLLEV